MKTGKEPFKCGMESAECGVRDKSDFRHRPASCVRPAPRPPSSDFGATSCPSEFGMGSATVPVAVFGVPPKTRPTN